MNMKKITKLVDEARYSGNLERVVNSLLPKRILRVVFESDYQGFVDIDIELKDGRVFSYKYYYGSCSGCDDWEDRELTDEQIEKEMLKESTIFKNLESYLKWRAKVSEYDT